MDQNIEKLWVIMYSKTQGYFHVEQMEDMIQRNSENLVHIMQGTDEVWPDYCVIGYGKTAKECRVIREEYQALQKS